MIQKEEKHAEKFIRWFNDLDKDSGNVAGGKGANLAEIYNLGIPVPPGFVVTAQAYDYFIEKAGIKEKIEELLENINYEDTSKLNKITKNIRALIKDSKMPKEMIKEIEEAYENLDIGDFDIQRGAALDILNNASEPNFVAVRSSATTEDLANASFAGQQETFLNIKGKKDLIDSIKKCFASLFTSRATYYREKKGFKHIESHVAVIVQKMIDAKKSGVIFSKDPSYKNDNTIIEAVWGLGEGIVSGRVTPDKYVISKEMEITDEKIANKKSAITRDSSGKRSIVKLSENKAKQKVLKNHEIKRLAEIGKKLEEHYEKPQDIEFAIENNEISIVQTRPITTMENRISEGGQKEIKGDVVLNGLAASPGVASGKIKIVDNLEDLSKISKGDVLVTKMTNPDMVVTMQKSSAIVTDEGGLTAHAAIVSREMGIPCIVGTGNATTKLKENEVITVDGNTGNIFKGKTAETKKKQVESVKTDTKTKIKVIVDLPSFAERAAKSGIKKVGLTRIEGIIAESEKHPQYFLKKDKTKDYENIIYKGVNDIAEHFEELWVRTSDVRSDEFKNLEGAPKTNEANPMLGFHGIRYSLNNPKIFEAELNALKRISNNGKTIGILLPQVISVKEVQETKKRLKEIGFEDAKLGIMIETPASVQIIKDLVQEGIDFISFGTNDLTQYILAVDRGNERVQNLYNEMHPAILYQLGFVIRVCKRAGVETSICGQAGSKKEMVKFLVEKGIDSISVNADVAQEISEYVKKIEQSIVENTDKEPRHYEKVKEKENQEKNQKQENNNDEDSNDQNIVKNVDEAVKDIEKEKQEYEQGSKTQTRENNHKENQEENQKQENNNDEDNNKQWDVPQNKNNKQSLEENNNNDDDDEDSNDQNIVKNVDEAVKDIEKEKQEYEQGSKTQTRENNHKEKQEENQKQENTSNEDNKKQGNDKIKNDFKNDFKKEAEKQAQKDKDIVKDVNEAVKDIEKEKQDYEQESKTQTRENNHKEKQEENQKQENNSNKDMPIPMKFNPGMKQYQPDTEKVKNAIKELEGENNENNDNQKDNQQNKKENIKNPLKKLSENIPPNIKKIKENLVDSDNKKDGNKQEDNKDDILDIF